jgi:DNA-binding transcriptional ArsR family regulator
MDQLGTVLAAVSDPTRRAIIDRLARGPARVTEVAEPFAMSLNAVSKHVKVLERAGLVRRARTGREHMLELDAGPLRQVSRWTHRYAHFWNERLDRLEDFFEARGSARERNEEKR